MCIKGQTNEFLGLLRFVITKTWTVKLDIFNELKLKIVTSLYARERSRAAVKLVKKLEGSHNPMPCRRMWVERWRARSLEGIL
jgi:hypothetical protein